MPEASPGVPGPAPPAPHHTPSLLPALLSLRDAKIKDKLDGKKGEVRSGQVLNELCDKFFAANSVGAAGWPSTPKQVKMRNFLKRWVHDHALTLDAVADFAVTVELAATPGAYKRASKYN